MHAYLYQLLNNREWEHDLTGETQYLVKLV